VRPVTDAPETRWAKTDDGVHIAYQVVGEGPLDLVLVPLGGNHVELGWEVAAFARVYRRLASFSRMIRFDPRGTGMSDPLGRSEQPSLEGRAAGPKCRLGRTSNQRRVGRCR
jgi:pimeloyl-ACP methyl ester carboxylesterase